MDKKTVALIENKQVEKRLGQMMVFLILTLIFFLPLIFGINQILWNTFTLPKVVFFRVIMVFLLLLALGKVFISSKLLVKRSAFLFIFLSLLAFSFLLSTVLSVNFELSFWGRYDRLQGFSTLIFYLLFYLLLISFLGKLKTIKKILLAGIFSSCLVSVYGLIQYVGWDVFVWQEPTKFPFGRIFSSLGQPNFLAQFLVMLIPVTVFFVYFASNKKYKVFLAFLLLLQFLALVFTFSRAGWLAFLAGLILAFLGITLIKGKKKLFYLSSFLVLILGLIIGGVVFWSSTSLNQNSDLIYDSYLDRVVNITNLNHGSFKMRYYYWQASWQEFQAFSFTRKAFGSGPDTLSEVFVKHYKKDWGIQESLNTYPNRAHNVFWDILLSFGLFGLLASILFFGFILLKAIQYLKKSQSNQNESYWLVFTLVIVCLVYLINNLFAFSNITTYVYFYLVLAILTSLIFKSEKRISLNFSHPFKLIIFLAITIFLTSFGFYYNLDFLKADAEYMESRKVLVETGGDRGASCVFAIDLLNYSLKLNPVHEFYKQEYLRYNLNCFSQITLVGLKARQNMLAEIETLVLEKQSYDFKLFASRSYVLLADFDDFYFEKAEEIFQELISINSFITTPYKELAQLYLKQGRYQEALEVIKTGLEVTPSFESPFASKNHQTKAKKELIDFYSLLVLTYNGLEEVDLTEQAKQAREELILK